MCVWLRELIGHLNMTLTSNFFFSHYAKGVWPAFWMLPADDKYGGWPRSGEIDIMGESDGAFFPSNTSIQ